MTDQPDMPDFGFGKPSRKPPRPPGGGRRPNVPKLDIRIPRKGLIFGAIAGVLGILLVIVFVTKRGGIVEISDREVAVIVNYVTGEKDLVSNPGYKIFVPFVEQAFLFDKSPNSFLMEGESDIHPNHVAKLTVRANDGSNFWFDKIEIQYRLKPDLAPFVLADSGPGNAFKEHWVRAYARSVLRDVYGEYSTEEMADPTYYEAARPDAERLLNAALNPHGIEILQLVTPKPSFEARYETAIAERKVADQTVEKLKTRAQQLRAERERRLADVERDKKTEYEQLLGVLEAERIAAERGVVKVKKEADAYKIAQVAEGTAAKERMTQEAAAREEQARKEAEGLRARVEALAARGEILVRERLAEQLAGITFEVIPYRRDPSPVRIEHLGAVPAVPSEATARPGGQQ